MPINMPDSPAQAMTIMPDMQKQFGTGLVSGMQAELQKEQANHMIDLATQGSQLGLQQQQMDVNKNQADIPLQDLQRQLSMGTTQDTLQRQQEGIPDQVARGQASTQLSTDATTQLSNKEKQQMIMGNAATEIDNVLGDATTIPLPQRQAVNQKWESMGFPPLPTDPAEARDKIKQYADWNANNADKLKAKAAQASAQEVAKIRGVSLVDARMAGGDATVEAARIRAAAATQNMSAKLSLAAKQGPKGLEALATQIMAKQANPNGPDGPPTSDEMTALNTIIAMKIATGKQSVTSQLQGVGVDAPTSPADKIIQDQLNAKGGKPPIITAPVVGSADTPQDMPKTAAGAKTGSVYNTAHGPMRWTGTGFVKP